jgi:hypothetical protein
MFDAMPQLKTLSATFYVYFGFLFSSFPFSHLVQVLVLHCLLTSPRPRHRPKQQQLLQHHTASSSSSIQHCLKHHPVFPPSAAAVAADLVAPSSSSSSSSQGLLLRLRR